VASVGLIVGRQAHPFFGSKIIVSLVEPPTRQVSTDRHRRDEQAHG
jgi:hypothetical protein